MKTGLRVGLVLAPLSGGERELLVLSSSQPTDPLLVSTVCSTIP